MSFASGLVLADVAALQDPSAIVIAPDPSAPFVAIILTRRGHRISAFRNTCPHAGYPLQHSSGRIIVQGGRYMVCAAHGASFTLEDGACAGGPCNGDGLERIAIEIRDGVIRVA